MRIIIHAQFRIRNRDFAHGVDRGGPRSLAREFTMQSQRFGNLFADGEHGIKRSHRILKDHRHIVAAHVAHPGV